MYNILISLVLTAGTAAAMGESGGGDGGGGGTFGFLLPIILLIGVFYLLVLRPQQKKEKDRRAMISAIKRGDRVVTAGGIRGIIIKVYEQEKFARVEIAKGVEVDVAIAKIEAVIASDSVGHPQQKMTKPGLRRKKKKR